MVKEDLVFIIDDDLIQNEIHTLLLTKIYPEVVVRTYTSAREAIQAIDGHEQPGIIFLDMHMPGESETCFLDAHLHRRLTSEIFLMSSMAYIDNPNILTIYPAIRDFISKPLLEHKIKSIFNHYA